MDIFKDLLHANQFVVEFIVSAGVGQEGVSVGYEQVEDLHHLQFTETQRHSVDIHGANVECAMDISPIHL